MDRGGLGETGHAGVGQRDDDPACVRIGVGSPDEAFLATRRQRLAAALLQATSLSFLVVAGQIGVQLDLIRPAAYAALVAAGLLSVLFFPLTALTLLRGAEQEPEDLPKPAR